MYQGKHSSAEHSALDMNRPVKKRQLRWKKQFALVLSVLVLVLGIVGGSLAWLTAASDSVANNFTYAHVTCSASCTSVQNTGDIPAYIRIAVVPENTEGKDIVEGFYPVSGDGWIKNGNYYIYTQPVQPGAYVYFNVTANGSYNVIAEAIQSQPADAVVGAWGYDPKA